MNSGIESQNSPVVQHSNCGANADARGAQTTLERLLLPSIPDLIFIVLLIAFTYGSLAPRLLWDGDVGWHIRNGQNILAAHAIPRVDSFSETMAGRPWYSWEWLYDAAIGGMYNWAGLNGVVFANALVIALTLALVFALGLRRSGNLAVTLVLFVFCAVASSIHFLARPHVVGWLITIVWFWILDSADRNQSRISRVLWLPLIMLLWANVHGGFVLGFVLLAIYVAASVLTLLRCRVAHQRAAAKKRISILIAAGISSFLTSLINPYGIRLHEHVYAYLTNRFYMQHINEFRRPDVHGLPTQFFLILVLLTVVAIIARKGRLRWAGALVILFSTVSGLWAARNLPVASMLLVIVVAPLLAPAPRDSVDTTPQRWRLLRARFSSGQLISGWHLWPLVLVLMTLVVCSHHGNFLGKQMMDAHFDLSRFPIRAVDFLEKQGIREPVYSLDSWGGYMIWRLYPQTKVFVDDRHDFYGEQFVRDYLKVLHAQPGWQEVLNQLKVNIVLLPAKSKTNDALSRSGEWQIVYQDSVADIFERH
ncbi:MAG TPA: hypothetical protein VFI95_02005 [Terriglobales bacterium]|nr:hypothetical protein [Terriglobales bacterium]